MKIAKSFARIHRANLVNFGIIPLIFADPADYGRLEAGMTLNIPGLARAIASGEEEIQAQVDGAPPLTLVLQASAREREMLAAGGLLNFIRGQV